MNRQTETHTINDKANENKAELLIELLNALGVTYRDISDVNSEPEFLALAKRSAVNSLNDVNSMSSSPLYVALYSQSDSFWEYYVLGEVNKFSRACELLQSSDISLLLSHAQTYYDLQSCCAFEQFGLATAPSLSSINLDEDNHCALQSCCSFDQYGIDTDLSLSSINPYENNHWI